MIRPNESAICPQSIMLIECDIDEQVLNSGTELHRIGKFSDLSVQDLKEVSPEIVVCPLFKPKFDAIDVGKTILKSGLRAHLLIQAPILPRPKMVLKEVLSACPTLHVEYFNLKQLNCDDRMLA